MKAIVKLTNPIRRVYAAEIDASGEYVIFKLLDRREPEIGDVLLHDDFYSIGDETFHNVTQDREIKVAVEIVCDADLVRQQCFA